MDLPTEPPENPAKNDQPPPTELVERVLRKALKVLAPPPLDDDDNDGSGWK